MALKNRDLLFIVKLKSDARAALRNLRNDFSGAGKGAADGARQMGTFEQRIQTVRQAAQGTIGTLKQLGSAAQVAASRAAAALRGRGTTSGGAPTPATLSTAQVRTLDDAKAKTQELAAAIARTNAAFGKSATVTSPYISSMRTAARESVKLTAADNALTRAFDFTRDAAAHLGTQLRLTFSGQGPGIISRMIGGIKGIGREALASAASLAKFYAGFLLISAAGSLFSGTISAFAEFDRQMAQVRSVAQATREEMGPLRDAAKELGSTTEYSAVEAGSALQKLVQNGLTAGQAVATLRPAADLATVGNIKLADSADALTKILAQYQLGVDQAAAATDVLNYVNVKSNTDIAQLSRAMAQVGATAKAFGISLNETAAAMGVLGDAGRQGSAAGSDIRRLLLDLNELAHGTAPKKALEVFKNLKINPEDVDPAKNGLNKAIEAIKKAGASRADLSVLFQNRGITPFLTLAAQSGEDGKLKQLTEGSKQVGGFNKEQAEVARDNLGTAIDILKNAFNVAKINLFEGNSSLATGIKTIVEFLTALVNAFNGVDDPANRFNTAIHGILEATRAAAIGFGAYKLATLGAVAALDDAPAKAGLAKRAFDALKISSSGLGKATKDIGKVVVSVFTGPFAVAKNAIKNFSGRGALGGLGKGLVAAGKAFKVFGLTLLTNPFGIILVAIGAVVALLAIFKDRTVEINGHTLSLGSILSEVWSRLVGVFQAVVKWIGGTVDTILGWFGATTEAGDGTAQGLYDAFKTTVNFIIGLFIGLAKSVGVILANILTPIVGLGKSISAVWSGDFKEAGRVAKIALGQGLANLTGVGLFKGVGKTLGEAVGKDYVGGFADSIIANASIRTSKERIANAKSKILAKTGGQIAGTAFNEGVEDGIDHTGGGVDKAAARRAQKTAEKFAKEIKKLQDKFDPQSGIERQYKEDFANIAKAAALSDAALQKMGISRSDLARIQQGASRQMERDLDILHETKRAFEDQIQLLGIDRDAREVEAKVLDLVNKAKEKNRDLTMDQVRAARAMIQTQQAATAFDDAIGSLEDEARALNQELTLTNLVGDARQDALTVLKAVDVLRRKGVLDEQKIAQFANDYTTLLQRQATLRARDNLAETLSGLDQEIRLTGVLAGQRDDAANVLAYEAELRKTLNGDQAEMNRLMSVYVEALGKVRAAQEAASRDAFAGVREGLQDVRDQFRSLRDGTHQVITDTFNTLQQSLASFLETGKFSIGSFVQSIGKSLIDAGSKGLIGSLAGGLDGLLGNKEDGGQGLFSKLLTGDKNESLLDQYLRTSKPIPVTVISGLPGLTQLPALGGIGSALGSVINGGDPGRVDVVGQVLSGGLGTVANQFLGSLGNGLQKINDGVGKTGSSFLGGFGGVLQGILGALGSGGGASGLLGGALGFITSIFADGGIMTSHGKVPLRQYSGGGIATSPQLALFGEGSTPEAYVPVPSGRIPVEMRGNTGGGMTVVHMNVSTPDANSFRRSRGQIASQMAAELSRQSRRNN